METDEVRKNGSKCVIFSLFFNPDKRVMEHVIPVLLKIGHHMKTTTVIDEICWWAIAPQVSNIRKFDIRHMRQKKGSHKRM